MLRPGRIAPAGALVGALVGVLAVATACADRPVGPRRTPGPPAQTRVDGGDAQTGRPGAALGAPVVVLVRDADGAPVPGAVVSWEADAGGRADPATSATDATGRARTRWVLGPDAGPQRLAAVVEGTDAPRAEFTAHGRAAAALPLDEVRVLSVATYDGSGQTVHPDVTPWTPAGAPWGALALAVTPYPFGNASHENPSFYADRFGDGLAWAAPAGLANPVARPAAGHLSDPDLVPDPATGRLRLYYREAAPENRLLVVESADGVRWDAPRRLLAVSAHRLVSPSVVRRAEGEWLLWSVDGGSGCADATARLELRRSRDGLAWSPAEPATLDDPAHRPWHVEVQWVTPRGAPGGEYWALYNAKAPGSCTTAAVYLATSGDGVRWRTRPGPVLARGAIPEFRDIVYRSTFAYDAAADEVTFWYSGARHEGGRYVWRSAVQRRRRADVFAQTARPAAAFAPPLPPPPPLVEWP